MRTPGVRTVTAVLRVMGLATEHHFTNDHRVLNRATWSARQGSRMLLGQLIMRLVPSEATIAPARRPPQARRALVDGDGAARDPAHVRQCQRHRQRRARGQPPPDVVVALARALVAWMGAMATPVPVTSSRWRRQGPGLEPPTGSPGTVPQAIGRSAAPGWGPPSTA